MTAVGLPWSYGEVGVDINNSNALSGTQSFSLLRLAGLTVHVYSYADKLLLRICFPISILCSGCEPWGRQNKAVQDVIGGQVVRAAGSR